MMPNMSMQILSPNCRKLSVLIVITRSLDYISILSQLCHLSETLMAYKIPYEMVIVDPFQNHDFKRDIESWRGQKSAPFLLKYLPFNSSLRGRSLIDKAREEAIKGSKGEVLFFLPLDGTYLPTDLLNLYHQFFESYHQIVVGPITFDDSTIINFSFWRFWILWPLKRFFSFPFWKRRELSSFTDFQKLILLSKEALTTQMEMIPIREERVKKTILSLLKDENLSVTPVSWVYSYIFRKKGY